MLPAPVTLSVLAKNCQLSVATVSRALSGHPNVKPEVRARVLRVAEQCGYRRNQLVSELMGQMRGRRTQQFIGNLAVVHVPTPSQPAMRPMQRRMITSAQARGQELGFAVEVFSLNRESGGPATLGRVLRARGIVGVIFLQPNSNDTTNGFPWANFATLQIDYGSPIPKLHTVCLDHHLTLTSALGQLRSLGYGRAGMFIERHKDERLIHKWSAAFRSFQENQGGIDHLPVLMADHMNPATFMDWYRRHRPDLIIGHVDQVLGWLRAAGVSAPADIGFFNLNWNERSETCAGLDLQPELHGIVAVETIAAQIHRHESGLPDDPRTVAISGKWVDGPTVRATAAAPERHAAPTH
ncbi:LacI family DNA-binding transcriptional regulator [Horticoccus luteus]|uniref:LacI family DNA-binding transcriptional regulator n=1 Tax=Horticoccus luteus TaxID=2862869 RepID=A0A8F9TU28_9BACT|nr:LacI family DNA-binding transcriptional regulator [Horticoccus luteus]QYM77793.1 LacI family DNA-binding transcriptional regulator [Horticoccus luteus]